MSVVICTETTEYFDMDDRRLTLLDYVFELSLGGNELGLSVISTGLYDLFTEVDSIGRKYDS